MSEIFDRINGQSLESLVAGIAGNSPEMDEVALLVETTMKSEAAKHNSSGAFEQSITTVKAAKGKDRIVGSTDPLAVPKEFGHVIKRDGDVIGYVKGMHILGKTLDHLPKVE